MAKQAKRWCQVLGLTLLVSAASPLAGASGGRPFVTELTGAAEVPGPGDPDGSGTARITVNPGRQMLCWELFVQDIEPAVAAHVHRAPAGVAGPVVVPLSPPTDGSSEGCAEIERALALEILRDPENFYVNVHNAPFPGGALRGQLG